MTSRALKERLRELLAGHAVDELRDLAGRERRVLGALTSLTFDPDPLIGWRAVEAMGIAGERIAERDPRRVQEHLRRLRWLLSDESGGVCWRAPEAMAEIVRALPDRFPDYIALVVYLLLTLADEDLERFRAGVLWAIGRLGSLAQPHVPVVLPRIVAALDDPDAQVRSMAIWCLGQLGQMGPLSDRPDLRADEREVVVFEDGGLHRRRVRDLLPPA